MEKSRGISDLTLIVAMMAAAGVMSAYLMVRNPGVGGDSLRHLIPVHNLVQGRGYTYFGSTELLLTPGYGILSYMTYLLVGDIEYSAALISSISYLLSIPLAYYACRLMFGRGPALLSAFLFLNTPMLASSSSLSTTECVFTFFLLLSLYAYLQSVINGGGVWRQIILGASMGVTYLIRPEGFIILPPALLFMYGVTVHEARAAGRRDRRMFLESLKKPAIVLMSFSLCAAPYVLFLHGHTGRWMISTKMEYNLLVGERVVDGVGHVDALMHSHPEYFKPGYRLGLLEYLESRGGKYLVRLRRNIMQLMVFTCMMSFHAIVPLAIIVLGLALTTTAFLDFRARMGLTGVKVTASLAIFALPAVSYVFFFVKERFLLPYAMILLMPAAYAMHHLTVRLLSYYGRERWVRDALLLLCLTSFTVSSGVHGVYILKSFNEVFREGNVHESMRKAGLWLRESVVDTGGLRIISPRKGDVILFYATGGGIPGGTYADITPDMSLYDVSENLDEDGGYLVLESTYVNTRPNTLPLWENPETAGDYGLDLVYKDDEGLFQVYGRL
ncbi:MAG: glycosyltransferase family 39 protein [Candidatus Altiarchaeota archaeon]